MHSRNIKIFIFEGHYKLWKLISCQRRVFGRGVILKQIKNGKKIKSYLERDLTIKVMGILGHKTTPISDSPQYPWKTTTTLWCGQWFVRCGYHLSLDNFYNRSQSMRGILTCRILAADCTSFDSRRSVLSLAIHSNIT